MTEVSFHVNVSDPLAYACRLVRKGYLLGMTTLVVGDARQTAALNQQLWAMRDVDFVPHCLSPEAGEAVARSAVVLVPDSVPIPERAFDVLVNLSARMPQAFTAFAKVFEVVSFAEPDLASARQRWRAYTQAGLHPKRHETQS